MHLNGTSMGHRLSEQNVDRLMVSQMLNIHGESHDGYIQRHPVSSVWMDRFAAEVCLFKPNTCELVIIRETPMDARAGGSHRRAPGVLGGGNASVLAEADDGKISFMPWVNKFWDDVDNGWTVAHQDTIARSAISNLQRDDTARPVAAGGATQARRRKPAVNPDKALHRKAEKKRSAK